MNLLALDRELQRVAEAWQTWRRGLRDGVGLDHDPFAGRVALTGRTLFHELGELPDTEPLRQPLMRWVYRLAEQRINRPLIAALVAAWREQPQNVEEPERGRWPAALLLSRALEEDGRRDAWLNALCGAAAEVGRLTALLWERRQEIAVQMGLPAPDVVEGSGEGVTSAAVRWLARTGELLETCRVATPGAWIHRALGRDATEGWPARIDPAGMQRLLPSADLLRHVDLSPGRLPRPLGAASYLRALLRVGAAWADATAPSTQPFVIAHDAFGLGRRAHGALFASLPATDAFARRRMALGSARRQRHLRQLGTVLLLETRAAAWRVTLRAAALSGASAFRETLAETAETALGVGVRPQCLGVLWKLHTDDSQRFAGWLLAAVRARALRDAHDEDWFDNPRAVDQLRAEATLSPPTLVEREELEMGQAALEESLRALLA